MCIRDSCNTPWPGSDKDRGLEARISKAEHLELVAVDVRKVEPVRSRMIDGVCYASTIRQRLCRAGDNRNCVDAINTTRKLGIGANSVRVAGERLDVDQSRECRCLLYTS